MGAGRTNTGDEDRSLKLLRYGPAGHEKRVVLAADGSVRDLSAVLGDIAGPALTAEGLKRLKQIEAKGLPRVDGQPRLGPPVGAVGKMICVGLNYADHAAEAGMAVPTLPVIFMKATTAIVGPNDNLVIPR